MSSNEPNKQTLQEMVARVINEKQDWSKHIAHGCCRCEKCTCGKHLCKFQPFKLHLKPSNTTYLDSYGKQHRQITSQKLTIPSQTYHPHQFIQASQYKDEYYRKKAFHQKTTRGQKKNDNISLGGPGFVGTTYQNSYVPKYADPPQKIKNADNLVNSRSRMNGTSSYRHNYDWSCRKPAKREQPSKKSDNIRAISSDVFNGDTNYRHDYGRQQAYQKDRDNFAPQTSYNPCRGLRPKSSYRCDYTGRSAQPCPALRCPTQKCC